MLLWFVFCVSGKVARVLNMLFSLPSFLGFGGVAYSCLFGFGRFRCSCVSCFCFLLCVGFVSVLFVLFCCSMLLFLFLLFFFFVFFCFFGGMFFVFWGGFKGQVRWPKGPPHLALNPPYFLFLFFFEGLRVRCGGPKGHLTWP